MADGSHIEWTDATWNPITGCSVISPGCANCYAMRLAGTRLKDHPSRAGLTAPSKAGPVWTGEVRFNEAWLDQPLRWSKPRRIFVCAHGDLFHEAVPDAWIDKVFTVMALADHHTFQVLTKRPERMRAYFAQITREREEGGVGTDIAPARYDDLADEILDASLVTLDKVAWPLPNVWLGVSVEDQARADERIPILLDTPAAVRWISAEPLLGPIDLTNINIGAESLDALAGYKSLHGSESDLHDAGDPLDWVVVGGERGDRPLHPNWVTQIRDQCEAADVPFFFKQWGDWAPISAIPDDDIYYYPAPRTRPDARRKCKVETDVLLGDGTRGDRRYLQGTSPMMIMKIGARRAGRLLDGRIHDAMPRAA